jgi:L-lactate dehydrogenase (cytochrome)
MLTGAAAPRLETTVLGRPLALPVGIAPTGLTGLVRPEGEIALARAAQDAGTVAVLSCMASRTIEEVAAQAHGRRWFQLYLWRDRALVADLAARAAAAGCEALVVTVDVPVSGARERDLRNGFGVPPRLTLRTLAGGAVRPRWAAAVVRDPRMRAANVAGGGAAAERVVDYVARQFDPGATWDDVARLRETWSGPLVVKGILRADDAQTAVAAGADAVWVSNHGGRQLDGALSSIRALPRVADAVGDRADVLVDGGFRRGIDVLRALALGARAVFVGRPAVYGLAAGGRAGAHRALAILRGELERACVLAGVASVADAGPDLLAAAGPVDAPYAG